MALRSYRSDTAMKGSTAMSDRDTKTCPPSEFDPMPKKSRTPLQEHNRTAFSTKDDGVLAPISSVDPAPPGYGQG